MLPRIWFPWQNFIRECYHFPFLPKEIFLQFAQKTKIAKVNSVWKQWTRRATVLVFFAKTPLTPKGEKYWCILFTNLCLETHTIALQYFVSSLFKESVVCFLNSWLRPLLSRRQTVRVKLHLAISLLARPGKWFILFTSVILRASSSQFLGLTSWLYHLQPLDCQRLFCILFSLCVCVCVCVCLSFFRYVCVSLNRLSHL